MRTTHALLIVGLGAASASCAEADSGELSEQIRFATAGLPEAELGVPYAATIELSAPATADLTWTLVRGGLPEGLAVTYAGPRARLEGVPRSAGTFELTFFVFDAGGLGNAEATFTLTVAEGIRLAILADPLPAAEIDAPYEAEIAAQGGSGGYAWAVAAGALPDGLALSPGGTPSATLQGTPSEAGRFTFIVAVEDGTGAATTREFVLEVGAGAGPLRIESSLRTGGVVRLPYEVDLVALGGEDPIAWRAIGEIPGVRLVSDGRQARLTGTATATGLFQVTIFASDATTTATLAWNQRIVDELRILPDDLSAATVGEPFGGTLRATPGAGGHQWTVVQGGLPPGLVLRPMGEALGFGGAATSVGDFPIVLEVRDASAQTATRAVTLEVVTPLEVATTALAPGVLGQPYASPLAVSGGREPIEWFLVPTGAPAGLLMADPTGRDAALGGIAGEVGRFAVALRVRDADGRIAGRILPLDIADSGQPLRLLPVVAPAIEPCEGFAFTVTATGGSNFGYRWRLTGDVPLGVSIDPIGTPTTAVAGLIADGAHPIRVEVIDTNGTVAGQDVVLDAGLAQDPPRLATLGVDGGIPRGRLALADVCLRAPRVLVVLPGTGTATETAVSMARGSGEQYIAWSALNFDGARTLYVSNSDPDRRTVALVPQAATDEVRLGLALSDVAGDGRLRVVYPVRRVGPSGVPEFLHRFVTLTSTVVSPAADARPPRPSPSLGLTAHLFGLVRQDGPQAWTAHRFLDPTGPGQALAQGPAGFFGITPFGLAYGRSPGGVRRVNLGTGALDAPLSAGVTDGLMGPRREVLLVRRTSGGPWSIAPAEAAAPVEQSLPGSEVCGPSAAWAFASNGGVVACIASPPTGISGLRAWSLRPVSPTPRVLSVPGTIRQLWVSPSGTGLVYTATLNPQVGAQVYLQDSRHGPAAVALTGGPALAAQDYDVWFARDRVAVSGRGRVWVYDLAAGGELYEGQGSLPSDVNPWRADGTGLFLRTSGLEWLDLLPPNRPRVRAIQGGVSDLEEVRAMAR